MSVIPQPVYRSTILKNGLRLGSAELAGRPVASIGLWTCVGSRHESDARAGIAHFLEHMVFKGPARRSARRIVLDIEGVGGEINALTSEDHTVYHAVVPKGHLATAADVIVDLFLNARFAPQDMARERAVILEEIQMYRENPGQHVDDLLSEALWPKHPLGRIITGTATTLGRMDVADLQGWYRRSHVGANAVLAVASPWPHEEVLARLGPLLEKMPRGRVMPPLPYRRRTRKPTLRVERRPLEQSHAAVGFRTPGLRDHRRFALRVMSVILGETMGSRLFQSLRERRGLCYTIQSELDYFDDIGVLAIYTAVEGGKLVPALKALATELGKLRERNVGVAELKRAREFLLGQQALWFESTDHQMHWVGDSLRSHGRVVDPSVTHVAVESVTAEAVREVASACLTGGHGGLAVVGPDDDEPALRKALGWGE